MFVPMPDPPQLDQLARMKSPEATTLGGLLLFGALYFAYDTFRAWLDPKLEKRK